MKNKEIHITFHNPNNERETEQIAKSFISKMAFGFLNELVLKNIEYEDTFSNEPLEIVESM